MEVALIFIILNECGPDPEEKNRGVSDLDRSITSLGILQEVTLNNDHLFYFFIKNININEGLTHESQKY